MSEHPLPPTFRGSGRFTPQEHIGFEYRIDRRHRLLRRSHMFPNRVHPSKTPVSDDFYVCNSIHAHNLRAGLVQIAGGAAHAFPDYPNEHLLLHLSGDAEWALAGDVFVPRRGARLFAPAFLPYEIRNTGTEPVWLVSAYVRVSEWLGTSRHETAVTPGCDVHRYVPAAAPFDGNGIVESDPLSASRNRSVTMDLAAGAKLQPEHRPTETVWIVLEGQLAWHVDGHDLRQDPEDLLFIPAFTPFSCSADGGPVRAVRHDVELTG